jgi:hypothetical protein
MFMHAWTVVVATTHMIVPAVWLLTSMQVELYLENPRGSSDTINARCRGTVAGWLLHVNVLKNGTPTPVNVSISSILYRIDIMQRM